MCIRDRDTLLSFCEELTTEEINVIVCQVDSMFKEKPFEEVFLWVKKKLGQYPNCDQLIWQMAVILDAQCMLQKISDPGEYEDYLCSLLSLIHI